MHWLLLLERIQREYPRQEQEGTLFLFNFVTLFLLNLLKYFEVTLWEESVIELESGREEDLQHLEEDQNWLLKLFIGFLEQVPVQVLLLEVEVLVRLQELEVAHGKKLVLVHELGELGLVGSWLQELC